MSGSCMVETTLVSSSKCTGSFGSLADPQAACESAESPVPHSAKESPAATAVLDDDDASIPPDSDCERIEATVDANAIVSHIA